MPQLMLKMMLFLMLEYPIRTGDGFGAVFSRWILITGKHGGSFLKNLLILDPLKFEVQKCN